MEPQTFVYSQPVIEFLTVSTEYCKQLEQLGSIQREQFRNVMLGLLPMLYLKATFLGDVPDAVGYTEARVTEDDYNYVRTNISNLMGDEDTFLEVFVEEFRLGYEEAMEVALAETMESFRTFWGQQLLNTLRTLHADKYRT